MTLCKWLSLLWCWLPITGIADFWGCRLLPDNWAVTGAGGYLNFAAPAMVSSTQVAPSGECVNVTVGPAA